MKKLEKNKQQNQKAIDKFRAIQNIGTEVEVPWNVLRFFPDGFKYIDISNNQISLGGDFGDLSECQYAAEWIASQLGGTVKWEK